MSKSKASQCVITVEKYQGVNTPIFTSTANRYREYDDTVYPRYYNTLNQKAIGNKLAALEGGEFGMIFSSGMAAISTAIFSQVKSGDHIIISSEIYGGTHKLILSELEKFQISYDFVSGNDPDGFERLISENTKVIYTETPSNPLLTIVDLKALADIAKKHGVISIVDNTFASPINQNPILLGFDIVTHSGTKYLSGHSDLCFGAVITNNHLGKQIYECALNYGGSLNALDNYLIDRSIKTLAVRVERQNENASKLAELLHSSSQIKKVYYPGLTNHPGHEIAKKQMIGGFGGMLSFELNDNLDTEKFLDTLEMVIPAVSLGGVETIICQPSKTSHIKMPVADRLKMGITDNLLRLSVGIEDVNDIWKDLHRALEKL